MKNKNILVYGALIGIAMMPIASCSKKEGGHEKGKAEKTTAPQYDPASKFAVTVVNIVDSKPMGATFTSKDDTNARARIGGTLVSLNVTEGSYVSQGQTIGVISEARYNAEVAAGLANAGQGPAQLEAARAMANKSMADYNRTKTLYDQGVYSKARLDAMQAAMAASSAQVRSAEAASAASQSQAQVAIAVRNQGRIIAPRAGKVVSVPVTQGVVLMPGEIVAFIAAGQPILKLFVPERDAKSLKIGQSLSMIDDNGNVIGIANITKIYPQVVNGQIEVELSSSSTDHFVGERTNLMVPLGHRDAVVIPQNYIITRQGVDYVRLLKGNNPLEVPVQRGIQTSTDKIPNAVEVLSGLQAGDIIVAPQSASSAASGGK